MRKGKSVYANIAKGVLKKLARKKSHNKNNFQKISWSQEKILKHQDKTTLKNINLSRLKITYQHPYELLHTYTDLFQKEIYKFRSSHNRPVIIDCGANIGLSVLYFKSLYPNADVHAFEPDSGNFKVLKQNISTNNLTGVTLHHEAVWVHDNGVSFNAAGTEASHINLSPSVTDTVVNSIRLSEWLKKFQHIDFLKLDIEGAEYEVITDCFDQLNKIDNLFIEYHGTIEETIRFVEILEMVAKKKFAIYIKNAADLLNQPFYNKKTGIKYDVQLNIFCYRK